MYFYFGLIVCNSVADAQRIARNKPVLIQRVFHTPVSNRAGSSSKGKNRYGFPVQPVQLQNAAIAQKYAAIAPRHTGVAAPFRKVLERTEIGKRMIDSPSQRAEQDKIPVSPLQSDPDGGHHIGVVLLDFQSDGFHMFRQRPAQGVEVADDQIRPDTVARRRVNAAVGTDGKRVLADKLR